MGTNLTSRKQGKYALLVDREYQSKIERSNKIHTRNATCAVFQENQKKTIIFMKQESFQISSAML